MENINKDSMKVKLDMLLNSYNATEIGDNELFQFFYLASRSPHIRREDLHQIIDERYTDNNHIVVKHIRSILNLSIKYVDMKLILNFSNLDLDTIKRVVTFMDKLKSNDKSFKHCKNAFSNVLKKGRSSHNYTISILNKMKELKIELEEIH